MAAAQRPASEWFLEGFAIIRWMERLMEPPVLRLLSMSPSLAPLGVRDRKQPRRSHLDLLIPGRMSRARQAKIRQHADRSVQRQILLLDPV